MYTDFDTPMEYADYEAQMEDAAAQMDDPDQEMFPLMTMVERNGQFVLQPTVDISGFLENDIGTEFVDEPVNAQSSVIPPVSDTQEKVRISIPNKMKPHVLEKFRANKNKKAIGKAHTQVYRSYSDKQIVDYINLLIEQHPVQYAASKAGITLSTAYRIRKIWNENDCIPAHKPRGPKKSNNMTEEHVLFILTLVDSFAPMTLDTMRLKLMEKFVEVQIKKTSFHTFIRTECCLSMKKLEKITEYRVLEETLENRKNTVQSFIDDPEMNYETNCVFLDEAGFNLYLSRSRGWSIVGTPCLTVAPKRKGNNITLLGAMCHLGLISLSLRKTRVQQSKKRDVNGEPVRVATKTGTRTAHFMEYITSLLAELDRMQLKGYHIVMDNASIHKAVEIQNLITSRGYKCVYLPVYSPFLNPIEELWSKLKYRIKRGPFETGDTLTPRIIEASTHITQADCQGWIRHSVQKFDDCLAKVIL